MMFPNTATSNKIGINRKCVHAHCFMTVKTADSIILLHKNAHPHVACKVQGKLNAT
jgi:hypothetical protein